MSTPHPIGIHSQDPKIVEGVDPAFLEKGLRMAREKTIKGFKEVVSQLEEGMSESTVRRLVYTIFSDLGCRKHWHKPHARFGTGTLLSFNEDQDVGPSFSANQPAYLDLGPVWYDEDTGLDYEGDFGDTFILGHNPDAEHCAKVCRELFGEAKKLWHESPKSGQYIYEFLNARSTELGFELRQDVCGHRVGDFPHNRYTKMRLSETNFIPSPLLWVLEAQILDPERRFGAFFEDLL
jgi:hypothetical protein